MIKHARIFSVSVFVVCLLPSTAMADTVFEYVSEPGDFIGQGGAATWTSADGTWTVSRNFDNGVTLDFTSPSPGIFRTLDFAAPQSVDLAPGFYADATRRPFQAADEPGLSIRGEGRGCNTLTGEFTIERAYYLADGSVAVFSANAEQHCEGAAPALFATIDHVDDTRVVFFEDFEDGTFGNWSVVTDGQSVR